MVPLCSCLFFYLQSSCLGPLNIKIIGVWVNRAVTRKLGSYFKQELLFHGMESMWTKRKDTELSGMGAWMLSGSVCPFLSSWNCTLETMYEKMV